MNKLIDQLEYTANSSRIISITGGPGFGKSFLAIHIGHKLLDERVDVVYVDVNEASSKHALAEKIVTTHQNSLSERNITLGDLYEWSKKLSRKTLLILDNCDELFHTNKDGIQVTIKGLIRESHFRTLKIVTTSRRQVM